jgi:hypothetical protein
MSDIENINNINERIKVRSRKFLFLIPKCTEEEKKSIYEAKNANENIARLFFYLSEEENLIGYVEYKNQRSVNGANNEKYLKRAVVTDTKMKPSDVRYEYYKRNPKRFYEAFEKMEAR